jgi:hypothetical protein
LHARAGERAHDGAPESEEQRTREHCGVARDSDFQAHPPKRQEQVLEPGIAVYALLESVEPEPERQRIHADRRREAHDDDAPTSIQNQLGETDRHEAIVAAPSRGTGPSADVPQVLMIQ